MIFNRIAVRGFQSFEEEQVIDLGDLSFVVITGPNGSGKSSIFDAISWAMFGKTRVSNDRDAVVNDKLEECEVILDLTVGESDQVRIIRRRFWQAESALEVHELLDGEWVRYSDHTLAGGQAHICEITGLYEDTFFSLCSIEQGSMISGTRFTAAKSNQRRNILTSLLPELDRWPALEATIGEMRREEQRDYDILQDKIDADTGRREEVQLDLDKCRVALSSMSSDEDLNLLISNLTGEMEDSNRVIEAETSGKGDLESLRSSLESARRARNAEIKSDRVELESRVRHIQSRFDARDDVRDKIDKLRDKADLLSTSVKDDEAQLDRLDDDRNKAVETVNSRFDVSTERKSGVAVLKANLDLAKSKFEAIDIQMDSDEAKCLVCDSKLTSSKVEHLHQHAADDLDSIKSDLAEAREALDKAEKSEERARSRLRNIDSEIEKLERSIGRDKDEIQRSEKRLGELDEEITVLDQEVASLEDVDVLKRRISKLVPEEVSDREKDLTRQISDLEQDHPLYDRVKSIKKEIEGLRKELQQISRLEGNEETLNKDLKAINKALRTNRSRLKKMAPEIEYMDRAREACGPKGIPDMLLGEILSQIEDEQNAILHSMQGDSAMQVEFLQEKKLKSRQGTKQELTISVKTPSGYDRPIETFSGGERVRLTLSNLFAMVKVFNARTPGMVRTLLLDEPLGQLDNDTLPIVQSIFTSMIGQGVVDSIFLMSHQDQIIDEAPQRMMVTKDASTDWSTVVEMA